MKKKKLEVIEPEGKRFDLIYVGDRFNKDHLCSAFVHKINDGSDKELYFNKGKYWIGQIFNGYDYGNDNIKLGLKPTENRIEDEKLLEKWNAKDVANRAMKKEFDAQEKIRKNPIPPYVIKSLSDYLSGLDYFEVHEYIKYVANEIMKSRRPKK